MWDVKRAVSDLMEGMTVADMVERSRAERAKSRKIVDFSI
jgi:hypothetical protein